MPILAIYNNETIAQLLENLTDLKKKNCLQNMINVCLIMLIICRKLCRAQQIPDEAGPTVFYPLFT